LQAAIRIEGLVKKYPDVVAVDGLDLEVRRGECFGLLGPNGAGKTTTIEILEGLLEPTSGTVEVLGRRWDREADALRARIGVALQETRLFDRLTVEETLRLFRTFYADATALDVEALLSDMQLHEKRRAWVMKLSGGQRQRLAVALGLVGDPEVLFLDEPTTGFDPSARRRSWELIDRLRSLRTTILLTTHYMEEAQRLADRVAVIRNGRIVAEGDPSTLAGREFAAAVVTFHPPEGLPLADLPLPTGVELEQLNGRVSFRTATPTRDLRPLVLWASEHGRELDGLTITRPSLEDVYLELTDEEAA
jgi:ABC-2 type transport system ATP-binding protein